MARQESGGLGDNKANGEENSVRVLPIGKDVIRMLYEGPPKNSDLARERDDHIEQQPIMG